MIKRDQKGIAHIVGVSGGKDSTALALALVEKEPRDYTFVCTPTGDELPEMFEHWRKLGDMLGSKILPVMGGTLRSVCNKEKALPNFNMRFCTRLLKIEPYGRFLPSVLPAVSYVGFRADEQREGIKHGGDFLPVTETALTQRYPLQEWGWGINEVLGYLSARGVSIPDRTDCARCPFQKLGEWFNLWKQHPDIYADAEAQERQFGHTFRSAERDTWPASLEGLRKRFETGDVPERSLKMMETRKYMCRACSL